MKLATGLFLSLSIQTFLVACSQAPERPLMGSRGGGGGTSEGESGDSSTNGGNSKPKTPEEVKLDLKLQDEFEEFEKSADEVNLKSADNVGKIPALVVKSQQVVSGILADNKVEESASPKGRCLLYISGDAGLSSTDISTSDKEVKLSSGGKFLYTVDSDRESSECQSIFREKLADRYKSEFFKIHEVFYSVK